MPAEREPEQQETQSERRYAGDELGRLKPAKRAMLIVAALALAAAGSFLAFSALSPVGNKSPSTDPREVSSASSVLHVTCNTDPEVTVDSAQVVAASDGVHVEVDSGRGGNVFHVVSSREPENHATYTLVLEPGINSTTLPIPPGQISVGCFAAPFNAGGIDATTLTPIEVTDPMGAWTPVDLSCPSPLHQRVFSDATSRIPADAASEAVREVMGGLIAPTDEIGVGGYADYRGSSARYSFLVERDEKTLAVATVLARDGYLPPHFPLNIAICPT